MRSAGAIAGAGLYYVHKGWARKYERYIRVTPTTRRLDPVLRGGFVAYGTVIAIVGVFLLIAALQADPSEARGIGAALDYLRSLAFGWLLLALIALGLLGFAVENLVEAVYRIVPGANPPDLRFARREFTVEEGHEVSGLRSVQAQIAVDVVDDAGCFAGHGRTQHNQGPRGSHEQG